MCGRKLRKGYRGTIKAVDVRHLSAPRLIEMGFTPGSSIQVIGCSPFGDPLMLRLRGYSVAVRKRDLEAVTVEAAGEAR